jgi:hypothetical protein
LKSLSKLGAADYFRLHGAGENARLPPVPAARSAITGNETRNAIRRKNSTTRLKTGNLMSLFLIQYPRPCKTTVG